jgi:hypothetical protein
MFQNKRYLFMRFIITLTVAVIIMGLITGCTKQNDTPQMPVNEMIDTSGNGGNTIMPVFSGQFEKGNEGTVGGIASVYLINNKYQLELKDFSVTNGPDLHVYLSKEIDAIHFIDLGKLKSTNGMQVYDIPNVPDFNEYAYTLIYCQQYSVLFGSAPLK